MALRAVAFDYGMVLSGPPHPQAQQELRRITGLSHEDFERHYWADRLDYDRGELTGLAFWQKLVSEANLALLANSPYVEGARAEIEELSLNAVQSADAAEQSLASD